MTRIRRGFTLVEVLIALTIFTMAAIVLGGSYLNVLYSYEAANRGIERNEELEFVRAVVMSQAEREEVEKGGEYDAGNGKRIRWRVLLEDTEIPDVYLVLLECVISSPAAKQPETIRQQFRLLRPTWTKGTENEQLRAKLRDRIHKVVNTQRQ
jgi:general secretion pathway protein I